MRTIAIMLVLVALAFLLYFVVRANVIDRPDLALANAGWIIEAERTLGIFHEAAWQRAILEERLLVRLFNFVYFWLDFPLIADKDRKVSMLYDMIHPNADEVFTVVATRLARP